MSILILSSPKDPHAFAVSEHLAAMNMPAKFWRLDDLLSDFRLKYKLTAADSVCEIECLEEGQNGHLDLQSFQSIWLRRPGDIKTSAMPEPWMTSFVEWESMRALDAIFRAMPGLWVNPPAQQKEALLKLRQLDVARCCGLSVPATLVTNDPDAVRAFYAEHDMQIIYKLIDEGSYRFFPPYEIDMGMPTLPFRDSDLEHLDQVKVSLHLFQQRIDKVSDLRVTVVGERIFAVEILSQEGRGKVDFRLDYSVPMRVYELPNNVADACLNVLRQLGLTFGAFDLCLDREGRHYFLEVNPAGQWLWMERQLSLPISLQLAKLLAGVEQPLVSPA